MHMPLKSLKYFYVADFFKEHLILLDSQTTE